MKQNSLFVGGWQGQKNIKNSQCPENREKSNGVENHVANPSQKISVTAQILFCY